MIPYIFVGATFLAMIPFVVLFKISVERIKENPEQYAKTILSFFIWVALIEAIPILLIVFGMMNMAPVQTVEELYTPGLLILLLTGFAIFFVFLQRTFDIPDDLKQSVHQFALIAIGLVLAIPMLSIVSLFLMIPS
ncbi:MAG TPA: hypothetical protein VF095_03670 [Bacillota bacterium]